MTPAQAQELQRLLALYWKQKKLKKRYSKTVEELVVLIAQIHMFQFKIFSDLDEDELNT